VKLLIHSTAFWPHVGGVESVVMTLAKGFAREAVEVTLVTTTPRGTASDVDLPFRVVRQPRLSEFVRLLRESHIVHLAGPAMLPLALTLLLRRPVVLEHHGFQTICPNGQLFYEPTRTTCPGHFMAGRHRECWRCNAHSGRWRSVRMWVLTFPRRWLSRLVKINIAPTHSLQDALRLPRTSVIWHGVDALDFDPRRFLGEPPSFVYLGRLVSTKGVHLLLDAAYQVRKKGLAFRVKLIGDGPERGRLQAQSQALGLEETVQFLGYLPMAAVEESLAGARAVVMPSLAGEVFGLVAAENMMRGCLMIVPDQGALAEVIGDAGLKFKSGDAKDLAARLEDVLRLPEMAVAFGQRARLRSHEVFSQERMIAAHLEHYHRILR